MYVFHLKKQAFPRAVTSLAGVLVLLFVAGLVSGRELALRAPDEIALDHAALRASEAETEPEEGDEIHGGSYGIPGALTPGYGFQRADPRILHRPGRLIPDTPYGDVIHAAASRYRINPDLVTALVAVESAFDPGAVSPKGARGLMQVMPATARRFGVAEDHLFNPRANVEVGVRYLHWLAERYQGDLALTLGAYNAGEAAVDRYRDVPPYRETREYVRRVLSHLERRDSPTRIRTY